MEFFKRPGAKPYVGRFFTERDFQAHARKVAVLSYRLFTELFGSEKNPFVFGRTVAVNGTRFVIVGVAAPDFHPSDAGLVWMPRPDGLKIGVTLRVPEDSL